MRDTTRTDPDLPPEVDRLAKLQLLAGRTLIRAVNLVRPRTTLGVKVAALDENGHVFLVRHSYLPGWHLPGGGVSPGETCEEAAARELFEEGGLRIEGRLELRGVYLNRALANRDHVVLFTGRAAPGSRRVASLEIREARFHPTDALPIDTSTATRARLAELLEGAPPSTTW
jgi:8-oxo-dGTP pyrophosphatase MutT (NUDIX family)